MSDRPFTRSYEATFHRGNNSQRSRDELSAYKRKSEQSSHRLYNQNRRLQQSEKRYKATIRDHELELSQANENNQNARMELADMQQEIQTLKKQLDNQKKVEEKLQRAEAALTETRTSRKEWMNLATSLRKDLKGRENQLKATQRDLQALQSSHTRQQNNGSTLQELRQKLATSQKELSTCKDDLFRLQPVAEVPDSNISKAFEGVCQQIVSWIDVELDAFEQENPGAKAEDIFAMGDDQKSEHLLRKYPGVGEHLTRYMIHRYLKNNLFGKNVYMLGLSDENKELLQRTEQSMASLDPPRDPATIVTWRSETLKGIAATSKCKQMREEQVQIITTQMFETLSQIFPIMFGNSESRLRFYGQVMGPAAKFATQLRVSSSMYKLALGNDPFSNWLPLTPKFLKLYALVDIKTRGTLKPNSTVSTDREGVFGKIVILLEPGLYRHLNGGEEIELRQQAFLVDLHHPLKKHT